VLTVSADFWSEVAARLAADERRMHFVAVSPNSEMEEFGFEFPEELQASVKPPRRFDTDVCPSVETRVGELRKHSRRPIEPQEIDDARIPMLCYLDNRSTLRERFGRAATPRTDAASA